MKRFPFSYFASTAFPALMAGLVIVIALILLSLCYKEPERPRFTSYDADLSKATAVLSNQLMQAYKAGPARKRPNSSNAGIGHIGPTRMMRKHSTIP